MNWLRNLFGGARSPPSAAEDLSIVNPVAIPVPEGLDPSAVERVPRKLFRADPAEAARFMREKNGVLFAFDRDRALSIGCRSYVWRTAGDADVCEVCFSRDGKRFSYDKEPKHGHAGLCRACPQGWCRCYAEPVVPG